MVDFKELLGTELITQSCDPIEIFERLDHQVGKESLRDPQRSILRDWYENYGNKKDAFVKLHTGQGKTLIGLLMLKSSICSGHGPAVYLCPNSYLVNQTIEQATSFGIWTTHVNADSPGLSQSFLNSEDILVTTCQKMFNGKSVFGVLGSPGEPVNVGTIVLDDAHKCLELIRQSFSIRVKRRLSETDMNSEPDGNSSESENPLYSDMWKIFDEDIRKQRPGTHSDILKGSSSVAAVPFWAWHSKQRQVIEVLQEHGEDEELLFTWDLIKDQLEHSYCLFSGQKFEITPRLMPIDIIPSFSLCPRRIFLSATLTEDAFIVRDLGVEPASVSNPLSTGDVKYSGERLILIPTLVDTALRREELISWVSRLAKTHGNFGVVALAPTSWHAKLWADSGAKVAYVNEIYEGISELEKEAKKVKAQQVLALVNEYDGVDLPDDTCRILALDSLPSYSTMFDKYSQDVRPSSGVIRRQIAQRVEQGMGRAIRGPSDWCIVIVMGTNLVNFLSETQKRQYLSQEAQAQIAIGETLAKVMRKEGSNLSVIDKLVNQSISRDPTWKEYYRKTMSKIELSSPNERILTRSLMERQAETLVQRGQYQKAIEILQKLAAGTDDHESGWYMQLMATYLYPHDVADSMDKQVKAFEKNSMLLRPPTGVGYSKLTDAGKNQATWLLDFIKRHENHASLTVEVWNILTKLQFGAPFSEFQKGMSELGEALGLQTQEPERVIGEGPDNFWHVKDRIYWMIECKNMVSVNREDISKDECGQMSNDIGWFQKNYEGCVGICVLVHPAARLGRGAFENEPLWVINQFALERLKDNLQKFYNSLSGITFNDLTVDTLRQKLRENSLAADDLQKNFLTRVKSN